MWWTVTSSKTKLRVGRLVKAHGLKGALKLELYTDSPDQRFRAGQELELQVPETSEWFGKTVKVAELRFYNQSPVLFLEGIQDRSQAETLVKAILLIETDLEQLPEDPEAWYDHQLVGLTALVGEEVVETPAEEAPAAEATEAPAEEAVAEAPAEEAKPEA